MALTVSADKLVAELLTVFDETFERVTGVYLDRGTSLFETLDTVDAVQASQPLSDSCPTIAAQVAHVTYYLDVLGRYLQGEEPTDVDWEIAWRTVSVTDAQWVDLIDDLRRAHASSRRLVESLRETAAEERAGDAMAVIVHTAYHLGEIRQALCAIRGKAS